MAEDSVMATSNSSLTVVTARNSDDYRLDDLIIRPSLNQIIHPDKTSKLKPMAMDLLVLLLKRAPEVVSADTILTTLWPDKHLEESTIYRLINQLRNALGNKAHIKTVPKRGYRIPHSVEQMVTQNQSNQAPKEPFPFVGRMDVIAHLEASFLNTRTGRGSLTLLAGEPGIGKTRTAEQFSRDKNNSSHVHFGWCSEVNSNAPYWPWITILRGIAADGYLTNLTAYTTGREYLCLLIPELYPPDHQDVNIKDRAQDPLIIRQRLADAICQVIRELAKSSPVLLIIDDLHRADEATLTVLELVAGEVHRDAIMIIGTYRHVSEIAVTSTTLASNLPLLRTLVALRRQSPGFTRLELTGLSLDEIRELADHHSGDQSTSVQSILEKTNGNPLYTNLLISSLNRNQKSLAVSDLREAIFGTVAAVDPEEGVLLNCACVLGRDFQIEQLRELADASIQSSAFQFLSARAEGLLTLSEDGSARFNHVLIQEVIYQALEPAFVKPQHKKAAELISQSTTDFSDSGDFLQVAEHYLQAEEAINATYWFHKAHSMLTTLDDFAAYRCCTRAIEGLTNFESPKSMEAAKWAIRTTLKALMAGIRINFSKAEADALLKSSQVWQKTLAGDDLTILLLTTYSDCLLVRGEYLRALQYANDAYSTSGPASVGVHLHTAITLIERLSVLGRFREANEIAKDIVDNPPADLTTSISDQKVWYPYPRILAWHGKFLAQSGDPAKGLALIRDAVALLRKDGRSIEPDLIDPITDASAFLGVQHVICECLHAAAIAYYFLKDEMRLARCSRTFLETLRKLKGPNRPDTIRLVTWSANLSGDWNPVLEVYEELAELLPGHLQEQFARAAVNYAISRTGNSVDTEETARLQLADNLNQEPAILLMSLGTLVNCTQPCSRDQFESGVEAVENSIERTGFSSNEPLLLELQAQWYKSFGDNEKAAEYSSAATEKWREMGSLG